MDKTRVMRPTSHLRILKRKAFTNMAYDEKILQQLWTNDYIEEEWRDVEIVEEEEE